MAYKHAYTVHPHHLAIPIITVRETECAHEKDGAHVRAVHHSIHAAHWVALSENAMACKKRELCTHT
eukprot:1133694-Pelagomonas_calceolata.AAC.5